MAGPRIHRYALQSLEEKLHAVNLTVRLVKYLPELVGGYGMEVSL